MELDLRWPIMLFSNLLLLALQRMLNHQLSVWDMNVFLLGLPLVFPALYLRFRGGFFLTLFTGMAYAAYFGPFFGKLVTLFMVIFCLVQPSARQLRRANSLQLATVAALMTVAMALLAGLWMNPGALSLGAYWRRILVDLAISLLVLMPVAGWFFDFQRALLRMTNSPMKLD